MKNDAGFTLLEVMAAFVIAALATAVLYQAGLASVAQTLTAAHTQEAIMRAQSRLASIGTLTALRPVQTHGDDGGGFSWQLSIVPETSAAGLTLYDISLSEGYGAHRITLTTKRLGQTP
jgi:general secretion pathway protein I